MYDGDDSSLFDRALHSIVNNSIIPNEIILVVDGHINDTLTDIISKYISQYPSLFNVVLHKKNHGLFHALNSGLFKSTSELIIRCDSDDVNELNRFESLVLFLDKNPSIDVLGSNILEVDIFNNLLSYKDVPSTHAEISRRIKYRNPMNHMSVAFRKSAVIGVGGYKNIYLREDYALWAELISAGHKFSNINHYLVRATTGSNFYSRRGGLRYALGEIELQFLLVKLGINGILISSILGFSRFLFFLSPSWIKRYFYILLFRKRNASTKSQPPIK